MINVEGAWHIMFKPRTDGRRNKHCVKLSLGQTADEINIVSSFLHPKWPGNGVSWYITYILIQNAVSIVYCTTLLINLNVYIIYMCIIIMCNIELINKICLYFIVLHLRGKPYLAPISRKNTILKKKTFYKLLLPLPIGELSHGDEVFQNVIFCSRISIFLLNMIVHVWTLLTSFYYKVD